MEGGRARLHRCDAPRLLRHIPLVISSAQVSPARSRSVLPRLAQHPRIVPLAAVQSEPDGGADGGACGIVWMQKRQWRPRPLLHPVFLRAHLPGGRLAGRRPRWGLWIPHPRRTKSVCRNAGPAGPKSYWIGWSHISTQRTQKIPELLWVLGRVAPMHRRPSSLPGLSGATAEPSVPTMVPAEIPSSCATRPEFGHGQDFERPSSLDRLSLSAPGA